jgi:lipoprotein-anchoring transpeptidase ErfK/SrfK
MRRMDDSSKQTVRTQGWWAMVLILIATAGRAQSAPAAPAGAQHQRRVVISLEDRKLALMEDGKVLKVFDVAVGKSATPSPRGEFRVANRVQKPTYYHSGQVIPDGPQNPVGTRWVGLNQKGYGIHGTNAPALIGKAVSHGCIRMSNHDIEELFELLRAGDTVVIRGERDAETAQLFGLPAATALVAQALLTQSQPDAEAQHGAGQ